MNNEKNINQIKKESQFLFVKDFQNKINEYLQNKDNRNNKLDKLINDIMEYKNEQKELILNKRKKENTVITARDEKSDIDKFKSTMYLQLENLVNDLLYITNPKVQKEKISFVYKWYHKSFSYFKELMQIKEKTTPLPNEQLTELERNQDKKDYVNQFHNNYIESTINNGLEHRTILNQVGKPSSLIKDFKRNHVNNYDKRKLIEFDNRKNVNYANFDNKEIKTSYSYNRPSYNFNQLYVEQQIIEYKNKELKEKRNLENIRTALQEFGRKRAFYKMNLSNKLEQMQILKNYYKNVEENKSELNILKRNFNLKKIKNLRRTSSVVGINNIHNELINKFLKEPNLPKNLMLLKRRSSISNNYIHLNNKVITFKIRNINENNEIDNGEKKCQVYNYSMKIQLNKSKSSNLLFIKNKVNDLINSKKELPSDSIFKFKGEDNIIKTRTTYQSMCSINQFDDSKIGYMQHFCPLSGFDMKNCNNFKNILIKSEEKKGSKTERIMTSSIYAKKNFNNNDFLELRKTMNNFKINEFENLKKKLNKSLNHSLSKSNIKDEDYMNGKNSINHEDKNMNKTLNNAFLNTIKDSFYPKLFLPKSGSGLLNIPETIGLKNIKKKKKK